LAPTRLLRFAGQLSVTVVSSEPKALWVVMYTMNKSYNGIGKEKRKGSVSNISQ